MEKISCPYYSKKIDLCMASLFYFAIDKLREEYYCGNEDYDQCPMFLSKLLRTSSTGRLEKKAPLARTGNK
ncbi:MAG: hypothetical protein M0Z59_08155 [Nitrospiraceae bacterium]|nr:hypothetical protein [Nitrospiraceae bacterium]